MVKETRYTAQYPHRESPLENLRMIRRMGWMLSWSMRESCGHAFSTASRFQSATDIAYIVEKE